MHLHEEKQTDMGGVAIASVLLRRAAEIRQIPCFDYKENVLTVAASVDGLKEPMVADRIGTDVGRPDM